MKYSILLVLSILIILIQTVNATNARVEAMGKNPTFFLDDATIFQNPANATLYSSALYGELGYYTQSDLTPVKRGSNHDAWTPFFGGLFDFHVDSLMPNPKVTIGGIVGRDDRNLKRLIPKWVVEHGDSVAIPGSVTDFDGFLAATTPDGSAIGAHVYVALQDGLGDGSNVQGNAHSSVLSMDLGSNFIIFGESTAEVTLGLARLQFGPERRTFLDPGLFSLWSHGRLFLEMDRVQGQLVPAYRVQVLEVPGFREDHYRLSLGYNVVIPRGLFWVGVHGFRSKSTARGLSLNAQGETVYTVPGKAAPAKDTDDLWGGTVAFGVERNVLNNWLVVRAGGQKTFAYGKCRNTSGSKVLCAADGAGNTGEGIYWTTNPAGDGTLDDYLGLGFGVNVEGKLRIDFSVAEDVFFRNPFLGEGRFISRISALYAF
jgi:hypothetical protein